MANRDRTRVRVFAAVCGVVALAFLCRRVVLTTESIFLEQLANFVRIFLYLGLFAAWGVSVRRRVVQTQVRRYLVAVSVLMVLWLTVREFRWHLVIGADARRWLWYAYYIPMTLIPHLALLVSLSLGRPEHYRLPRRAALLHLPAALLLALVLTNDLHGLVFRFPPDAAWTDVNYGYGPGYYVVAAWAALCALASFVVMLSRSRATQTRRFLWLPLVPFAVAVVYLALYAARVPFVMTVLGDLTVLVCLLFTAFFESCIDCGLIQSNTRYSDLFRASVGISAQITDRDYVVRYAARAAAPLPVADMVRAEREPVILPGGKRLHNMPLDGGHAVWTEDISELLALRTELESIRDELSGRNEIVRMEYAKEKEQKTLEEQNRLYDLMQRRTQTQLDRIKRLAASYQTTADERERKRILAQIVVLGSFIKRRKDLVLLQESGAAVTDNTLASAFGESYRSLALLGVRGAYFVRTERQTDAGTLARAYDFFEDCMESALDTARYLNVRVAAAGQTLRCAVETDGAFDTAALSRKYPAMRMGAEGVCLLPLSGTGGAGV